MPSLRGKTVFITGASRGIGKAIGIAAAREGANVVVAAKSSVPNPKLPGTIHSAAEEIAAAGGAALAVACDIREDAEIAAAVKAAVDRFGGIDVLVNNASAIHLAGTVETPMKRYDLMHQVNARRDVRVLAGVHPAPREEREPPHPEPLAAALHEPALVRAARRLHDGEVRHEPVRARDGGGARARGIAVNAPGRAP